MDVAQAIPQLVSQLIAFLIFYWVLKKFAWGPVMTMLDERRDRIKGEFDEIAEMKQTQEKLKVEYEQHLAHIEQEARDKVQEAVKEGRRVAEEIAEKARDEARSQAEKTKQMIELETQKARKELKEEIVSIAMRATETVVRERMDEAKHRELVSQFINDLGTPQN